MATLEDLEARIAALEAAQADYRAVLAAISALGANQRDHATAINGLRTDAAAVKAEVLEVKTQLRAFRRSNEEHLAELKDLIVGLRDT
jgi:prefoldin subunit 5